LGGVSKKLGDIYNSIFTETASFLAQLMEGKMEKKINFKIIISINYYFLDPVEEIEEKVHLSVKELEDMLEKSLNGHFV
jgi:hypothetical protein